MATQAKSMASGSVERREVVVVFIAFDHDDDAGGVADGSLERAHALLEEVLEAEGGRVDQRLADVAMALFGAPLTHGDDADRAIRAARSLRDRLADDPVRPRVALAAGQAEISRYGDTIFMQQRVVGEAVNRAARLLDHAGPNEILLSAPLQLAAEAGDAAVPRGSIAIPGRTGALDIWSLPEGGERLERDLRLVGRDGEIAGFAALLEKITRRDRGAVLLVRGEAGIGKTRFLRECAGHARAAGFACLVARVVDFGSDWKSRPLWTLLLGFLGLSAEATAAERQRVFAETVARGLPAAMDAAYLADLLDLPLPEDLKTDYEAMDNRVRAAGKREILQTLFLEAGLRGPLVVIVEDLHWADWQTLTYLAALAGRLLEGRLLLAVSTRPDRDPLTEAWRWEAGSPEITTVDLPRLDMTAARALAAAVKGIPAEVATRCLDQAGGNPLFLLQLLRSRRDGGEGVPGSIRSAVLERMDGLSKADRRALQAAAVLGQRGSLAATRHLLAQADWQPGPLEMAGFLEASGDSYAFVHALIRESVYSTLTEEVSRRLHRRAALWYRDGDPVLWVRHLERAGDPEARSACMSVARHLSKRYRFDDALELLDWGLGLEEQPTAELLLMKGHCLRELAQIEAAFEAFAEALSLSPDGSATALKALIGQAACLRILDRYPEALAALVRAEALANALIDEDPSFLVQRSQIYYYRGNICFPMGDLEGCQAAHGQALADAREAGSRESEAWALGGLADAYYCKGRMTTALKTFRECVALAQAQGFARIAVNNAGMVAWTLYYQAEIPAALTIAREAAEAASRAQQARAEMLARLSGGRILLEMDRPDEAREWLERGQALADRLKAKRFLGNFALISAHCDIIAGSDGPETRQSLLRAEAVARETGYSFVGPWVLSTLALLERDPGAAAAAIARARAALTPSAVSHNHFAVREAGMMIAAFNGDARLLDEDAAALRDYMGEERLPLCRLQEETARALLALRAAPDDLEAAAAVNHCRSRAETLGLAVLCHQIDRISSQR